MTGAPLVPILAERTLVLGLLFAAILLTVLGISWLIRPRDAVDRRLAAGSGALDARQPTVDVITRRLAQGRLFNILYRWLEPSHEKQGQLRERLAFAGYRSPVAVRNWFMARIALSLGLPAVMLGLLPLVKHDIGYLGTLLLMVAASCGFGFLLPSIWLGRRVRSRTQAIRLGFPDTLDMMLVCVEAGLGIDAALYRTTTEIGRAHPVIAEEMALMTAELGAGKQRADVLKDFGKRTQVEEVRSLVTVLIHSEQFGTSIADALRVYAAEMRTKRMLRAEEEANKLSVKLSLVVAGCSFPALFILLLTPMVLSIIRAFDGMGR